MKSTHLFALVFTLMVGTSTVLAQAELPLIPPTVAYMYVFLQTPDSTDRGSGREIATMISPDEFRKNFERYRDLARKEKVKLVITAETKDGQWVQNQISYKGAKLQRAPYRNPGIDKTVPGAEVPLN